MAQIKFNISKGFKEAFGQHLPLFGLPGFGEPNALPKFGDAEIQVENYPESSDRVTPGTGLVVGDRIRFEHKGQVYKMPHEILVGYNRPKNIVKTPMQGKDGTVKEYISMDDWQITIQGFIIDYDVMAYPIDRVSELNEWFAINKELTVVSDWMTRLGIFNVVVESLDLPPMPGVANAQAFELVLLSDEPVELELIARL